jgi:hypothetical protein
VGDHDPLICGEPRPEETAEAADAATAVRPCRFRRWRQERVLLIGDSTACSLARPTRGRSTTDQGSVFGCGVATDR